MATEAPRGTRTFVHLQRNGQSADVPIPFYPDDHINLSALWPQCMLLILYTEQKITAIHHGTGVQEVIIDNSKSNGHK